MELERINPNRLGLSSVVQHAGDAAASRRACLLQNSTVSEACSSHCRVPSSADLILLSGFSVLGLFTREGSSQRNVWHADGRGCDDGLVGDVHNRILQFHIPNLSYVAGIG